MSEITDYLSKEAERMNWNVEQNVEWVGEFNGERSSSVYFM